MPTIKTRVRKFANAGMEADLFEIKNLGRTGVVRMEYAEYGVVVPGVDWNVFNNSGVSKLNVLVLIFNPDKPYNPETDTIELNGVNVRATPRFANRLFRDIGEWLLMKKLGE